MKEIDKELYENDIHFLHACRKFFDKVISHPDDQLVVASQFAIIESYGEGIISHFYSTMIKEIGYVLGYYNHHPYKVTDLHPELNKNEKLEWLRTRLEEIATDQDLNTTPGLYKSELQFLTYEGKEIEVEKILQHRIESIYKEKNGDQLYHRHLVWDGGGYVEQIEKISTDQLNQIRIRFTTLDQKL